MIIRIGTRRSRLALAQTAMVAAALTERFPGIEIHTVEIVTHGDRVLDKPLDKIGGKGVFVEEIEQAMRSGKIDVAVHSAKDLPVQLGEGLEIAGVLPRGDSRDMLITRCGVEYSGGRGNVKETALNAMKGFLAVSLFTQVPVRLYELAVSLQADLTAGITGFGTTSIGDAAKAALEDFNAVESLTSSGQIILRGFGPVTSGLMVIFCLALMAYAVIKVFFANLKRGGILLIQIAVGSLYMFSVPRGYGDGFIQWCKQVVGLCLTAFLQATILVAGLMVFKDHALLGLGLMLSAGEIPRIAGAFGLDTTTRANISSAVYTAQSAVSMTRTVVAAVK